MKIISKDWCCFLQTQKHIGKQPAIPFECTFFLIWSHSGGGSIFSEFSRGGLSPQKNPKTCLNGTQDPYKAHKRSKGQNLGWQVPRLPPPGDPISIERFLKIFKNFTGWIGDSIRNTSRSIPLSRRTSLLSHPPTTEHHPTHNVQEKWRQNYEEFYSNGSKYFDETS